MSKQQEIVYTYEVQTKAYHMVMTCYTVYSIGKRCGMLVMYFHEKHRLRKDNIWHISKFINILPDILKNIKKNDRECKIGKPKNGYDIIFQG